MAQIDKIQVQSTTYDVAQSSAATFTGTSNDTATPTGWSDVNVLQNTETNGSIFTKISKMFANIRWLYNQLGTTDYSATGASTVSAALSALQSGKAAASHSHGVSDLPVTDQQNNSNSTIPTSALIYSMNQTLTSLNDAMNNIFELYQVNVISTEIQLVFKIRNTTSDKFIVRIFKSGGISLYDKDWNKYWDMI